METTTDIRVALHTTGTPIGLSDTAVAGHAIAAGAVLVTNNTREFELVPGLMLEDWVKQKKYVEVMNVRFVPGAGIIAGKLE